MRVMVCSRLSSAKSKFVAISLLFCSTSGSRVMMLGMMMLGGMIASEPNAKEKRGLSRCSPIGGTIRP